MRRIVLVLVCGFAVLGMVAMTMGTAGAATYNSYANYHKGTSLTCNDCHTMHGTLAHSYAAGTGGVTYFPGSGRLLKVPTSGGTAADMCLTCHGASTSYPDVLEDANATQKPRSAGGLNKAGTTPYETWKGHTLDASATPPGGGTAITLTCTSCHAQHGSTNFRNLLLRPYGVVADKPLTAKVTDSAVSATYALVSADVLIESTTAARPATYDPNFYLGSKIFYLTNAATPSGNTYAVWCASCHTGFNQTASGGGKHPTGLDLGGAGTTTTQFNNAGTKVPVIASALSASKVPNANIQPTCSSCHQPHGNQNAFGLLYVVSGTALDEQGGSTTAGTNGTCSVCHTQAN